MPAEPAAAPVLPQELRPPCPRGCVDVEGCGCEWNQRREAWPNEPAAAYSHRWQGGEDLIRTQIQETGRVRVAFLTLADLYAAMSDLGIDPKKVEFHDGYALVIDRG